MAEFGKFVFNGNDPVDIRDRKAVATDAQSLTDAQKTQARTNIGAVSTDESALNRCLVLNVGTISSLPHRYPASGTNSSITTDLVCVRAELGNPAAQTGDWTINTDNAGVVNILGTISGSTSCKLYMMKSR